jgi:L-ascorbate metabolism protein UlaG (beta-lactamase superfamily)
MAAIGISASVALTASAQPQSPPTFGATKVDGTENVYIFRYLRHQSMFIVTPQGTKAPIKYVIYSHSHFDHIAGVSRSRIWARPSSRTKMPKRGLLR